MIITRKKYFRMKIIILVLYLVFCLVGLPLIFIFPPRKFLFDEDSQDYADKFYLFKNFVSDVHDNINKKLIENMTLTKENEECPAGFETLVIKHQYYGNFTHFFKNSSFCIKRKDNPEWSLKRILEKNDKGCSGGQKSCGIANKYSNALLCIEKGESCPLNLLNYTTRNDQSYFRMADSNYFFSPLYSENQDNFLIIDVDLVYKYRLCLERFSRNEKLSCEFADNDLCYINDEISTIKNNYPDMDAEDIELTPLNLAKYNINNDEQLEHEYCEGAKREEKLFATFSKGFVNFNKENLDDFLEEFPDNYINNPLLKICETYKEEYNFETLFYYFACILFIWSFLHIVIQSLMFFLKNEDILLLIRKIFIWNGTILFIFKLICTSILIANHYSLYLKVKAVYLEIEEDPRNEILKEYKSMRRIFIRNIFIIWIAGFIIITIELILFTLIMTFSYLYIEEKEELKKENEKPVIITKPNDHENIPKNPNPKISNIEENNKKKDNPSKVVIPPSESQPNVPIINPFKKEQINLIFRLKHSDNNIIKNYVIIVDPDELFTDIEQRLKNQYSDLKDMNIGVFRKDSQIINKQNTVKDYNIGDNAEIIVDN